MISIFVVRMCTHIVDVPVLRLRSIIRSMSHALVLRHNQESVIKLTAHEIIILEKKLKRFILQVYTQYCFPNCIRFII